MNGLYPGLDRQIGCVRNRKSLKQLNDLFQQSWVIAHFGFCLQCFVAFKCDTFQLRRAWKEMEFELLNKWFGLFIGSFLETNVYSTKCWYSIFKISTTPYCSFIVDWPTLKKRKLEFYLGLRYFPLFSGCAYYWGALIFWVYRVP